MERIAVFPGSFDPFTIGHESIVRRALNLFDRIIIAIGINTNKVDFFPLEKRLQWIKEVFEYDEKVSVMSYTGLTVDFCRKHNARFIIRGLRTSADFEYERSIAQVNRAMADDIETIFILTLPEHTAITSTLVRDILRHGGDASKFLPNSKDLKNLRIH
ncbi:MAG: pantetheine-phosphate adenylyltransferase [Bacteroidales bacterium]